jgi:hypothetical protein
VSGVVHCHLIKNGIGVLIARFSGTDELVSMWEFIIHKMAIKETHHSPFVYSLALKLVPMQNDTKASRITKSWAWMDTVNVARCDYGWCCS